MWSAYRHSNPEQKAEHERIAKTWADVSEKTGIYEYYINGSWPGVHRLVVPQLAESLRFLHKNNVLLYQTQSGDEFGVNGINYYVAGKLMWDISLDEKKVLDDFYKKGFGNSADYIKKFHNRLESAWSETIAAGKDVGCRFIDKTNLAEVYNPQLLAQCYKDLENADAAAENDLVRQRIDFYRKGLRYTELTVEAVIATQKLTSLGIKLYEDEKRGPYNAKEVAGQIRLMNNPEIKPLIQAAVEAWEKRDSLVEQLKNDYVVAYFWVRYNDLTRPFNTIDNLKNLLEAL
jgi:hypothetical protein